MGFLIQDMEFDELGVPGQQPDTQQNRSTFELEPPWLRVSSLSSATWRTKKRREPPAGHTHDVTLIWSLG